MWTDLLFDSHCKALRLPATVQSHLKLLLSPSGAQNDPFRINLQFRALISRKRRSEKGDEKSALPRPGEVSEVRRRMKKTAGAAFSDSDLFLEWLARNRN